MRQITIEGIQFDTVLDGRVMIEDGSGDVIELPFSAILEFVKQAKKEEAEQKEEVAFTVGYLYNHVSDWHDFCTETELNPKCLTDNIVERSYAFPVTVSTLQKYGILPKEK
jgi:hypothetical protein